VLLGAMRPARDVGIYSAASVVVMAIPVVAGTLSGSLYPVLCRAGGLDDPDLQRLVRTVWRVLLVTGVVAAAASATLAGPVIGLLYGDAFAPAVAVMALLAWVLPMRFCNGLLGHTLNAVGRQAPRTIAVGVAAVVNLVANLALIPVLGYRGAVWATLATEVVLTAGLLHALRGLRLPVLRPLAEGGAVAAGVAVLLAIAVGGAG
jgi:O-antigen/teichoic acid export membrane protein